MQSIFLACRSKRRCNNEKRLIKKITSAAMAFAFSCGAVSTSSVGKFLFMSYVWRVINNPAASDKLVQVSEAAYLYAKAAYAYLQ